MADPTTFRGMQVCGFGLPGSELRRELVALVLAGTDRLGDQSWSLTDDTEIACQRFRLAERYQEPIAG